MKVLITGGAGFIGSHIVEHCLANGHDPFVVDNLSMGSQHNLPASVPLFAVDVVDRRRLTDVFREVRPDVVCHQAAQVSVKRSVQDPGFDLQSNILGLVNICEASVGVGVRRLVHASSGGVLYGESASPTDEDQPAAPISPYGIAKWACEQYVRYFTQQSGMTAVCLRYSNVYGIRQNPEGEAGVVAIHLERMLRGESPVIYGNGLQTRDFVYVDDVARANLLALTAELADSFVAINIGSSVKTTFRKVEQTIRRHVTDLAFRDVPPTEWCDERRGELRSNCLAIARAGRLLNWRPLVNFNAGIARTTQWYFDLLPQVASRELVRDPSALPKLGLGL